MALSVVGRSAFFEMASISGSGFAFLPFAWVALIPLPGGEDDDTAFAACYCRCCSRCTPSGRRQRRVGGGRERWLIVSLVALGNFVSLFVLFSQTRAVSLANIEELTTRSNDSEIWAPIGHQTSESRGSDGVSL